MGTKAILIRDPDPKKPGGAPFVGWYLLGWAGWVFLLAGLTDIGLAWIPLRLGNAEWEFGTISRSFDSLPLPFLGAALIMAAGIAQGKRWWARLGVIVIAVIGVWSLFCGVIYGLNVPLALRSVNQPEVLFGLKKSIFRTSLQVALYASSSGVMAWLGIRAVRRASREASEEMAQGAPIGLH
jgi:hypothetical protein